EVAAKLPYDHWVKAIAGLGTLDLAPHEACLHEHLEVLRDGALGQGEHVHDLSADTGAARGKHVENFKPRRMAQRFEAGGKGRVRGQWVELQIHAYRLSSINDLVNPPR